MALIHPHVEFQSWLAVRSPNRAAAALMQTAVKNKNRRHPPKGTAQLRTKKLRNIIARKQADSVLTCLPFIHLIVRFIQLDLPTISTEIRLADSICPSAAPDYLSVSV